MLGVWQVGQCRSFNFFGWPDKSRIRLSQILVPPNHQGNGVGRAILEAVYRTAVDRNALDVTVSASLVISSPLVCPLSIPSKPMDYGLGVWQDDDYSRMRLCSRSVLSSTCYLLRSCGVLCGVPCHVPCGVPCRVPCGVLCHVPCGVLCGVPCSQQQGYSAPEI